MRQVASAICQVLSSYEDCQHGRVFRYAGVEFAVILSNTTAYTAFKIAEIIRAEVKKLAIFHSERIGGLPASVVTVSSGIACTIPKDEDSPNILVSAAKVALYQSRRNQRDRTYISTTLNYGMSDNSNDI